MSKQLSHAFENHIQITEIVFGKNVYDSSSNFYPNLKKNEVSVTASSKLSTSFFEYATKISTNMSLSSLRMF